MTSHPWASLSKVVADRRHTGHWDYAERLECIQNARRLCDKLFHVGLLNKDPRASHLIP